MVVSLRVEVSRFVPSPEVEVGNWVKHKQTSTFLNYTHGFFPSFYFRMCLSINQKFFSMREEIGSAL
jgi:hypothetical protein